MARYKKYPVLHPGLKNVLKLVRPIVTCPRCNVAGVLSVQRGTYLVVKHYGTGSTHLVPADKVTDMLSQIEQELTNMKAAIESALATITEAKALASQPPPADWEEKALEEEVEEP